MELVIARMRFRAKDHQRHIGLWDFLDHVPPTKSRPLAQDYAVAGVTRQVPERLLHNPREMREACQSAGRQEWYDSQASLLDKSATSCRDVALSISSGRYTAACSARPAGRMDTVAGASRAAMIGTIPLPTACHN